jgi:hypothetical protein
MATMPLAAITSGVTASSSDVNGDGKADAIAVNANGIAVRLSTGTAFSNANPSYRWTVGGFSGSLGTFFADVNGDHKADAIAVNPDGIAVHLSTGAAFSNANPTHRWTVGKFAGSLGTFFADVNGDGKADAIAVNADGIAVHLSTGSDFSNANPTYRWTVGGFSGTLGTFFADVDGDGKADAIAVNPDGIAVRLSTGHSFPIPGNPKHRWTFTGFYGSKGTFFADVDADGKADAIAVNDDRIAVLYSVGIGFSPEKGQQPRSPYWTSDPFFGTIGTFIADVNGDKRADAIAVSGDGIRVRLSDGSHFITPSDPTYRWTVGGFSGAIGTALASTP